MDHWLLPREKVINSYVVENPDSKKITDFLSFYHLPSSILSPNHNHTAVDDEDEDNDNETNMKTLFAAYSFVLSMMSWRFCRSRTVAKSIFSFNKDSIVFVPSQASMKAYSSSVTFTKR